MERKKLITAQAKTRDKKILVASRVEIRLLEQVLISPNTLQVSECKQQLLQHRGNSGQPPAAPLKHKVQNKTTTKTHNQSEI